MIRSKKMLICLMGLVGLLLCGPLVIRGSSETFDHVAACSGSWHSAGTLRADLVLFPGGTIDLSIVAHDPSSVSPRLWKRVRLGDRVTVVADQSGVRTDELYAQLAALPGVEKVRIVEEPWELSPVGVQVTSRGAIRLAWYGLSELEAVAILREAETADPDLAIRLLIPGGTVPDGCHPLDSELARAGLQPSRIVGSYP